VGGDSVYFCNIAPYNWCDPDEFTPLVPIGNDGSGGWLFFQPQAPLYRVGNKGFARRLLVSAKPECSSVEVLAVDVLVRYRD
jgi:hypothetical protein